MTLRKALPAGLLFALSLVIFAQKRPLSHADYDAWKSISSPLISADGKLVAYGLFPQEGDGVVVLRQVESGKEWREAAGALPPPPMPNPELPPERQNAAGAIRLAFTRDSHYLVAITFPAKADTDKAGKEHKRAAEMPKGALLIIDTATGTAVRIPGVKSMQVPEKGPALVAYLKEAAPAEKPASPASGNARPVRRPVYGTDLVLRDLARPEPNERTFPDVLEYSLSRDGKTLLYVVGSKNADDNGVYAVDTASAAPPVALLRGKGKYAKLTWDRANTRAAFLSDRDDAASRQPKAKLYLWERNTAAASEIATSASCAEGLELSEGGQMSFARDGSRLFAACGAAASRDPAGEGESRNGAAVPADDKVVADLWRWNDDLVQPMQKIQAARERRRTYTAVYDIEARKFLQLADTRMRTVIPSDNGRYAIGADDSLYRRMIDYDGSYADQYLVDTSSGSRTRLAAMVRGSGGAGSGGIAWSPDSRHVLLFRDKNWQAISIPDGKMVNLTAGLGVSFYDTEEDTPAPPGNYGNAGWTSDSRWVLVYDQYDVWQISPDGRTRRNLTAGYGRRNRLQFRVPRLEAEEDPARRGINPEKPLLLRAENLENFDTGFFRSRLNMDTPPEKLRMAAKAFRPVAKAKDAGEILFTASTFNEFPDLQVGDSAFRKMIRVSDANPQKSQFVWGTGELVRFKSADGIPLKAALYKPENFDPHRKYPLIVYIYERLSQNLNAFVDPRPSHNVNASLYVSNGYLVLQPDIVYSVGAPGQSALKCVLPAVEEVVDRGFVDENAIGIQGHSWGGYQTAYLVGHTRRFRAAEAGAPVGDMISAYNGIRWGSGMPRQFQYEKTQSRIGGSLWQNPMQFIENSPIFAADRVETPLLILHDDNDDAVPWYQGIELFLSLRRLGKEAYLFNYNGELHGLRRRADQKDYAKRMQQFFDHFLKGTPAPEWMEKGIPYLEREAEKVRFNGN